MPDPPSPKVRPHPARQATTAQKSACRTSEVPYAELQVTSNFSFLQGASHPDELVIEAAMLGYRAIGITDRNSLAGIVRAHVAAKEAGLPLVIGCHIVFAEHTDWSLLAYPTNRDAYGRLCQLLTLGKRRAAKGQCHLTPHDVLDYQQGLLAVIIPPKHIGMDFIGVLQQLQHVFDEDRLSLAASVGYRQDDQDRLWQIAHVAEQYRVPMMATNDVRYHVSQRQALQDVVTCIRHGCSIEQAGLRLLPNAERHLKSPDEMARLFAEYPHAIDRTVEIAERATDFNLDQLRYQYPDEVVPAGTTPMQHLTELTWAGAQERYPEGVPAKVIQQIEHELRLIDELDYAHYFLTVHDIAVFARSRRILHQGRGAAANSAVCYCLQVTAVDPDRIDMLFERFVSKERDEPPDIDIDFEHERREEVIQYLYQKYGRDRAALTAEVITYRGRSAIRDVGKALGLPLDTVDHLAKSLDHWTSESLSDDDLHSLGLDPAAPITQRLLSLSGQIMGFPRHLSQHVGGFVITQQPLSTLVPIENAAMADRTIIEWDKDDIDAMGMLKVDVLGLGMLTCIRKCFELIEQHQDQHYTLANVPAEDPAVYDMICDADTIGVFQIESRAQMSMLPRLRPRRYYDLVIEVAIVRPGPIQGQMVHPYLRRRNGEERITYPSPEVKSVLAKTLGVPLFQEQVMSLAIVSAGFTAGEADQLRRAIAAWKSRGANRILQFQDRFIGGMIERGYDRQFAERCFNQIKGFGDYGFPESHAASFALLVYVSAWLKRYHPATFACALLNSLPMGFYAPAQIVTDARQHHVQVNPVDVNHSQWDSTLEDNGHTIRLGMRRIKGLKEDAAHTIAQAVSHHGPFDSIDALWRASRVGTPFLRRLANADAFGSMGLDRQKALWQIMKLRDAEAPLFEKCQLDPGDLQQVDLPPIAAYRHVSQDYAHTGLSLKQHPIAFIRQWLDQQHVTPAHELSDEHLWPNDKWITLAGLCLCRQRPGTASGITFMTLEDETANANLIVRPDVYTAHRNAARANVMLIYGKVERQGQVVHVMVHKIENISEQLTELTVTSRDFR